MSIEQDRRDRTPQSGGKQNLFREVNELARSLNGNVTAAFEEWLCECGNEACTQRIALTRAEYERLREHPDHYAVAPSVDHVFAEMESVVERCERFWVVATGAAAAAPHPD